MKAYTGAGPRDLYKRLGRLHDQQPVSGLLYQHWNTSSSLTATIMAFLLPRNDALGVNPVVGVDEALSMNGSDWLWAVTAIYIVAFVSPPSLSLNLPHIN